MQVASATSTFAMLFSSSMSVVQYYLLNRFPVPYGKLYIAPYMLYKYVTCYSKANCLLFTMYMLLQLHILF
jgi:hypothetical protein